MKKIIFTNSAGGVSIITPCEGARMATAITKPDGAKLESEVAQRVDMFLRQWPVEGVVVEWCETEDEFMARIAAKDVPADATDVRIVAAEEFPDRTFRAAWMLSGMTVEIDMAKARDIHRDRLRVARAPLLAALDIEYQRADEADDASAKAEIVARKQVLRDITGVEQIELAKTPADLVAVWPEVLSK